MSEPYKIIDESTWPRAMHCAVFRNSVEPCFCITLELDITRFLSEIKREGLSFTLAMTYAVSTCANEIEAFRYRFLDGKIVLFDKIDTAFTYISEGEELFKVVSVPLEGTMVQYVKKARETADAQKEYFTGPLGNDVFQFSALPWVSYTAITHTNSGKKDNATPLFDWGKFFLRDGKTILPFSIQAHHSFVDGIHVGRLVERLQEYLDTYEAD